MQTLNDFLDSPITQEQLENGKNSLIGSFSISRASNANLLNYLSIIGFYDLPFDFLTSFSDKIKNISALEVQQAFNRLIDPNKLIILTVGQRR